MADFSDFIVFADESGDHGLETIDPQFPVFSLVFCIFEKAIYSSRVEPAVRDFKFRHFGHDAVILHEREIRKQEGAFQFLRGDPARRERFFADLDALMRGIEMQAFVSVILKERLRAKYVNPWNPYEIAMHFCMEKLCQRLEFQGQKARRIHILFESRGKVEDRALELEFRRITANAAGWGWKRVDFSVCEFEPVFVPKAANLAGHQITDLIARPLALRALRPEQPNRAVDAVLGRVLGSKSFP